MTFVKHSFVLLENALLSGEVEQAVGVEVRHEEDLLVVELTGALDASGDGVGREIAALDASGHAAIRGVVVAKLDDLDSVLFEHIPESFNVSRKTITFCVHTQDVWWGRLGDV